MIDLCEMIACGIGVACIFAVMIWLAVMEHRERRRYFNRKDRASV